MKTLIFIKFTLLLLYYIRICLTNLPNKKLIKKMNAEEKTAFISIF